MTVCPLLCRGRWLSDHFTYASHCLTDIGYDFQVWKKLPGSSIQREKKRKKREFYTKFGFHTAGLKCQVCHFVCDFLPPCRITIEEIMVKIRKLFHEKPELVDGFDRFLPPEQRKRV